METPRLIDRFMLIDSHRYLLCSTNYTTMTSDDQFFFDYVSEEIRKSIYISFVTVLTTSGFSVSVHTP